MMRLCINQADLELMSLVQPLQTALIARYPLSVRTGGEIYSRLDQLVLRGQIIPNVAYQCIETSLHIERIQQLTEAEADLIRDNDSLTDMEVAMVHRLRESYARIEEQASVISPMVIALKVRSQLHPADHKLLISFDSANTITEIRVPVRPLHEVTARDLHFYA